MRFLALSILLSSTVLLHSGIAVAAKPDLNQTILDADEFVYDQEKEIISAIGRVELVQNGKKLAANKIVYNMRDDIAFAEGDISFTDERGDVHHAEVMELSDNMRAGMVKGIYSVLEDGSRLWAEKAVRKADDKHVLSDARYTPCKACENDPDKTPPWALRASTVTHDKKNALIEYEDVRFEAWGTPVVYAPYFAHPDGTIKQKSGFLAPDIGFASDYGFNFMAPYYWAISPDMDVTAGLRVFSKSLPQANFELRKRFDNANVKLVTSATYSERTDRENGVDVFRDEDFRGHLALESLWNINQHWRAGTDIKLATDEQYLDQYNIDGSDVLKNRVFTERFEDRDYLSAQLLAFQDLRLDSTEDQPNALPLAEASYITAPNAIFGGRGKWDSSFLTLYRADDDQDMVRLNSELSWQRREVLPLGLTAQVDLGVRGDLYYTLERDVAKTDPTEDDQKFDSRAIPTANLEIAYPLHKKLKTSQIRVKPRVGITVRPDIDNDSDIPNEDSIDTQIDYTNLFEIDRFAGYDRVEDRSRINYGVETGYYMNNGDNVTFALGQSYRLDQDDNPFQNGSGFEKQQSDIVGQLGISLNDNSDNLNYRFQLDGRRFKSERHEFYGGTSIGNARMSAIYLYEKGDEGTEFTESREQVKGYLNYKIDDNWSVSASALYDLGEDSGLRESIIGLGYDDDCYGLTTEVRRSLQTEASGSNDTTVLLRFRLKNLGEFETTAYGDDMVKNKGSNL